MRTQMVTVDVADGRLPIYDVEPDGEAASAVIVVQEAYGVNEHIQDVTRRFAAVGYRAVAPQLFHRDGVNALPYDFAVAQPHLAQLTTEGIGSDIAGTTQYLGDQGFSLPSVGAVGFCVGGSVSLLAASDHALGAAITFYGGGITAARFGIPALAGLAPGLRSPWLGLFGDLDATIPVDDVELLRVQAANADVPTSIVRYSRAGHAFHCDARPANYDEAAATDAWAKTLDWLSRYLRPSS